jgi:hypothetical protein
MIWKSFSKLEDDSYIYLIPRYKWRGNTRAFFHNEEFHILGNRQETLSLEQTRKRYKGYIKISKMTTRWCPKCFGVNQGCEACANTAILMVLELKGRNDERRTITCLP